MTEPQKAAEVKRTLEDRAREWLTTRRLHQAASAAAHGGRLRDLHAADVPEYVAAFAREVLEEAAKVAMGINGPGNTADQCQGYSDACREIAAAIRQMKEGW